MASDGRRSRIKPTPAATIAGTDTRDIGGV
jgi:hypothetical protein